MTLSKALKQIDKKGVLLVFPIKNKKDVPSIWSEFYPRTKMKWEWDDNGDDKVVKLWHLRAELAESRKVVYAKWFKNRATVFSFKVFPGLLRLMNPIENPRAGLSPNAKIILDTLEMDSPLSTKELRKLSGFQGKFQERAYTQAMTELWGRLLIVGTGEKDDGAFPSLMIAATKNWFEEIWSEAFSMDEIEARSRLEKARVHPSVIKFVSA